MASGTVKIQATVGGVTIDSGDIAVSADHPNPYQVALAAGLAGTLTTRSGDGAGVITMAATGHGIAGSDIVDVYWSGGARYSVTIDSIGGAADVELTFDDDPAATGDVLPAYETAVVVCERATVNTQIDGDAADLLVLNCTKRGQCTFYDSGDAIIKQYVFKTGRNTHVWYEDSGETNPLTGNPITYAKVSCGETAAGVLTILSHEDSTP